MKIVQFDKTQIKWLIYGHPKSGKTHFASTWPDPYFILANEAPMHAVKGKRNIVIDSVKEMNDAIDYAIKQKAKTLVVDSLTGLYEIAEKDAQLHYKVDNLTDVGYGKGQDSARNALKKAIARVFSLDIPVLLLAHVYEQEVTLKTGQSYTKTIPAFTKKELEIFISHQCTAVSLMVDTGKKRVLRLRGDEDVQVGHSLPFEVDSIDNPTYQKVMELLDSD